MLLGSEGERLSFKKITPIDGVLIEEHGQSARMWSATTIQPLLHCQGSGNVV
jgi:hypothetical protein